jgi:Flp pilus assembly pilin Flp
MVNFGWIKTNKGQGMVEYILIVAVVVGVVFVAYKALGNKVKNQFEKASKTIQSSDRA